jgi:hypothetical protein
MNYYTKISLNIILIAAIMMFGSFIPEYFASFFGDYHCNGCHYMGDAVIHEPTLHWGWRHWIWLFMSIALFGFQIFRLCEIKRDIK